VTAAYFHDVGYYGLFQKGQSGKYDAVQNSKELHMINGALMAQEFLTRPDIASFYTPEQIARVVHLVGIHDKISELTDLDELVLMEADTLGANDLTRVHPTYNREDGLRYIEATKRKRVARFTTDLGKQYLAALLPQTEAYYRNLSQ
jgi:hypothetical protein